MILNKYFNSDQSSKNSSFHKLNFPSLSHKGSENPVRERNLDLAYLPFSIDNQSATDCSSAGKFFRQIEGPKTTRAASHSFRMPKVNKAKESFLHLPEPKPLLNSDHAWEVSERIDSFKIRAENSHFLPLSTESIQFQLQLWKNCSNEILSVIKGANNELSNGLFLLFTKIFQVFDDLNQNCKQKIQENKEKFEDLQGRMRKLQKELLKTQQENVEMLKFERMDEEKIKKEVEEMFPNNDEEIKRMKEESLLFRSQLSRNVPETLEKIWANMQTDEKIPEATEIDFSQFNSGEMYSSLQENYKFIVNRTVKHVKTNLTPKVTWSIHDAQTEVPWIDPKFHTDLLKQMEKLNLAYQSSQMQLEGLKEDLYNKNSIIEKVESDKGNVKNEALQTKRELEMLGKEIQSLKLDLDVKRSDYSGIKKQSDEKTVRIVELESKVDFMNDKILDLSYELEKTKRSRPPSGFIAKNKEKPLAQEVKEESKKSKLDEVTKSGLTVREEMEKLYSSNQLIKKTGDNELTISYKSKSPSRESPKGLSQVEPSKHLIEENSKQTVSESSKVESKAANEGLKNTAVVISVKTPETRIKIESNSIKPEKSVAGESSNKDKKQFIIPDIDNENDSEEVNENLNEEVVSSVKTTKKSVSKNKTETKTEYETPKTQLNDTTKKVMQRATQKINLFKTPTNTNKKSAEGKKPSQSPAKTLKPTLNLDPIPVLAESINSEYLDSEGPYNRISSSKYNEPSVMSNESIQKSRKIPKNPEKPQIKIPSASNTYSKHQESISSSSLSENFERSPFEESENYENIEKSIEKLAKTGKIDPDMEKIASLSQQNFNNPGPLNKVPCDKQDKCSGNDCISQKDVGVQINMNKKTEDPQEPTTYFLPYNPNNIYGLRGDVYYQKSSFQPQSRIPDLNSSLIFAPPYKFN